MMLSSPHILIFGGTGMIGSEIIRQLVAKNIPVSTAVRDITKAEKLLPKEVKLVKADFNDPASLSQAVTSTHAEKIFLYGEGTTPADLAAYKQSGVKHIVFISTNFIGMETPPMFLQKNVGEKEEAIKAAGFTYTMLRAESFMSNIFRWKYSIAHQGHVKVAHPDAPIPAIAIEDIASVAVEALTTHHLDNQTVVIAGPQALSTRQQVAIIGQVLGKNIQLIELTEDQYRSEFKTYLPEPLINDIFIYYHLRETRGGDYQVKTDKLVIGKLTFQQFIEKHKSEFIMPQ